MGLSDHQFGKYLMTRSTERSEWESGTEEHYDLFQEPKEPGTAAFHVGQVSVGHREATADTLYPTPDGGRTMRSPSENVSEGYTKEWAKNNSVLPSSNRSEVSGQIPLFRHYGTPASSTLDLAIMSKGARHMAGTMVGTAALHTMQEHGRILQASDDLSPHSQRMVEHLKGVGAVPEEHDFHPNTMDWVSPTPAAVGGGLEGVSDAVAAGDSPTYHRYGGEEMSQRLVPATDVRSGQRLMRSVLRQGRSSQAMDQGVQESLFSGEKYEENEPELMMRDADKKNTLYGKPR